MSTNKRRRRAVLTIRPTAEPIRLILVTPRYDHHGDASLPEEFEHARFWYEENTCPTNWLGDVVRFEVGDDADPHGFVELTSLEDMPPRAEAEPWCCEACMGNAPIATSRPKPEQCETCGARAADLQVRDYRDEPSVSELWDRIRALEAELAAAKGKT